MEVAEEGFGIERGAQRIQAVVLAVASCEHAMMTLSSVSMRVLLPPSQHRSRIQSQNHCCGLKYLVPREPGYTRPSLSSALFARLFEES